MHRNFGEAALKGLLKCAGLESQKLLKFEHQERSTSERLRGGQLERVPQRPRGLSDRLSKKIMSSYEWLRSASGARLRSSSDRLQSRMGSTNSLALGGKSLSQTQGFPWVRATGPNGKLSPSWLLTPAWRGVGVCRAREDEKSPRSVVRSQSAVPCVGRAGARDPHTKDTVEEATGDSGRGSLRVRPSSRVAATRDHASLPLSRKTADTTEHTLLHPQAPRTRQEFTHSFTHSLTHSPHSNSNSKSNHNGLLGATPGNAPPPGDGDFHLMALPAG